MNKPYSKKFFDNNNKLQVFEHLPELLELSYQNLDELNSNIHLRSLTLNLADFDDIFTLIQHTPNLIYLDIQSGIPYKTLEEYLSNNIGEIKLEEVYLEFKSRGNLEYPIYISITDFDRLFRFIELFSPSLITLSLNFNDVYVDDPNSVLLNSIELAEKLLKPMKKLQNFYFYFQIEQNIDVQGVLSTFATFP